MESVDSVRRDDGYDLVTDYDNFSKLHMYSWGEVYDFLRKLSPRKFKATILNDPNGESFKIEIRYLD